MKTLFNKSSKKIFITAAKLSIVLSLALFVVVNQTQTANGQPGTINDIKSKGTKSSKSGVRPTPKTVTGTGRNGAGTGGRPRGGTGGRPRGGNGVRNPTTVPTPTPVPPVVKPTPAPVPEPIQPTPTTPPMQTPEQIMERFIDFQQSSSVTVKDWESVVAQTQSDGGDPQAKAQLFIARGYMAYDRADYSNALVQFKAAALEMSDSALPHYSIGRVYLITKQPSQAENAFERAMKLNKKFALAYQGMGDALTAQNKAKKAREYYDDAARIAAAAGPVDAPPVKSSTGKSNADPVDPTTLTADSAYNLELRSAQDLTKRKKWQQSLDKLLPLAKSNPTADVYIAIGDNYSGMEQWVSALQAYQKATALNPASALALYKSGLVLFETNEFEAASEAFEKSLILDQTGLTINRDRVRKMADEASEKAKDMRGKDKKKKFLFV